MTDREIVMIGIREKIKKNLIKIMDKDHVDLLVQDCLDIINARIDAYPRKRICDLCVVEKPVTERTSSDPREMRRIMVCKECMTKHFSISLFEHYEYI